MRRTVGLLLIGIGETVAEFGAWIANRRRVPVETRDLHPVFGDRLDGAGPRRSMFGRRHGTH